MIDIKENFIDEKTNTDLFRFVLNSEFGWFFQDSVVDIQDGNYMFCHTFYNPENKINSGHFHIIQNIFLKKLPIKQLLRVKLNFYPRTDERIIHGFHTDYEGNHKVALYYLNTNNGQTVFENKDIDGVNSVAQRMVIFNGNLRHSSTTCTDKQFRISLNINYEQI